jgi:hypothetical protein
MVIERGGTGGPEDVDAAQPDAGEFVAGPGQGTFFPTINVGVGVTQHASPMPSGADLSVLEHYAPGATSRLLDLQERAFDLVKDEADFRHEMARAESRRRDKARPWGVGTLALLLAVVLVLALTGHNSVAIAVASITVGVLAIIALGRTIQSRRLPPEAGGPRGPGPSDTQAGDDSEAR